MNLFCRRQSASAASPIEDVRAELWEHAVTLLMMHDGASSAAQDGVPSCRVLTNSVLTILESPSILRECLI
jgi:hypothetical protein